VGTGKQLSLGQPITVGFQADDGASTYLEDHARRYDGRRSQLHQGSSVTCQHHPEPVQWIRVVGGDNAVKWHLTHN